jgi:hypothetical protein
VWRSAAQWLASLAAAARELAQRRLLTRHAAKHAPTRTMHLGEKILLRSLSVASPFVPAPTQARFSLRKVWQLVNTQQATLLPSTESAGCLPNNHQPRYALDVHDSFGHGLKVELATLARSGRLQE